MLILVPLKTQENAVAKWKGGGGSLPNGKQLYFQDLRRVHYKNSRAKSKEENEM